MGTSQTVPPLMSASLLSIPSQCTMGRKGWSGNIPNCTTPHVCIPTLHPIPMYHGKEGKEWEHPKLYHIPMYCGREGIEWEHPKLVPPLLPASLLSIHPNVPWEGRDRVGTSHTVPPTICIPIVHPIPMYHSKEGMEWEHPKLYHPSCLHPYCPSHPNVSWEGRGGVGTSQTVPPLMLASLLSQCTVGRKE